MRVEGEILGSKNQSISDEVAKEEKMENEFSQRLIQVAERKMRKEKVRQDLEVIQETLNTQVTHLESLQVQLEQEQLDVDKLRA